MTVVSSRTMALTIFAIGGALALIGILFAVLAKTPLILVLFAFPVFASALSGTFFLRPLSLGIEDADLVYRSGRKVTRISRSQIASCTLTRGSWVLSDAGGARLAVIQASRFDADDIAAVCAAADIPMLGAARPADAARTSQKQGRIYWWGGIGLLLFSLLLMAGSIWAGISGRNDLASYRAAAACVTLAPMSGCRFEGTAKVTGVKAYSSSTRVDLQLTNGAAYNVYISGFALKTDDLVEVEVWNQHVALINGHETRDNPALNPNLDMTLTISGSGVFVLASIVILVIARGQMRSASTALAGVATAPAG